MLWALTEEVVLACPLGRMCSVAEATSAMSFGGLLLSAAEEVVDVLSAPRYCSTLSSESINTASWGLCRGASVSACGTNESKS